MATSDQLSRRIEFLTQITSDDLTDVHLIRTDTAMEILTDKRLELLRTIGTEDVSSVRQLARLVDRDVSIVSRDLSRLVEADLVTFVEESNAKRPILAHRHVLVEPIVYDGRVIEEP